MSNNCLFLCFQNPELESLFQRYASKVQNRSSFLIFAIGSALFALLNFRLTMDTLALTLISVIILALWVLQRLYSGARWLLTSAWILLACLFCVIYLPAPIPHRFGEHCNSFVFKTFCFVRFGTFFTVFFFF